MMKCNGCGRYWPNELYITEGGRRLCYDCAAKEAAKQTTPVEQNLIDLINSLVFYIDVEDPKFANWIEAETQRIVTGGDSYKGKEYSND